jgi:hypothetical protein
MMTTLKILTAIAMAVGLSTSASAQSTYDWGGSAYGQSRSDAYWNGRQDEQLDQELRRNDEEFRKSSEKSMDDLFGHRSSNPWDR